MAGASSGKRSGSGRWKKVIIAAVALVLIAFSTVYLVHYFGETRPTIAGTGRTHAVKIHERTVYLTNPELALAYSMHGITVLAVGVFLGLLLKAIRA
jgi:hypothetical protein